LPSICSQLPQDYCTVDLGQLFNTAHASRPCAAPRKEEKAKRVGGHSKHRSAKGRGQGALASLM